MSKKIVDADHRFEDLPFKCPICGDALIGYTEEWIYEDDSDFCYTEHLNLDCVSEPNEIGTSEWNEWFKWHYSMPYVDWLPLCIEAAKWVNKRYKFQLN